jgi:hypothetical protein
MRRAEISGIMAQTLGAVWKDVAPQMLDNTCQQRTGRYEEDGCWPAFEKP